jgi:transposase
MHNKYAQMRLRAVRHYFNYNASLRQTALKYNVALCTIVKWVKLYREQGETGLCPNYRRPWNRAKPDLEEKIALMKEHEPGVTLYRAKQMLEKEGIRISIKGIWGIWKRYGYAGFGRKNMTHNFIDCSWTKEAIRQYELAKHLFDQGNVDGSAMVLNSIPALPENGLLPQIDDSLLNIRRQVEKVELLFGKIPVSSYLERLRMLYGECHNRSLYYSALTVGLLETMALSWKGKPLEMLAKVDELRGTLKERGNEYSHLLSTRRLSLLISEGIAEAQLMMIEEAFDVARACRRLLRRRKHVSPIFMFNLGQLYSQLEDYREGSYWYSRALDKLGGDDKTYAKVSLADICAIKGEYKKALNILKDEELNCWGNRSLYLRIQSVQSLVNGRPHRAISLATEALVLLKKEEIHANMISGNLTMASAYCSLGEKTRARCILKALLPFYKKNKQEFVKAITEILLAQTTGTSGTTPLCEHSLPAVKLALMLKNGQYFRALKYAEKKGILCFLHKYIFFFPELITRLLEKGKPTGLPRAMLNFPVFRKEIPVYSVKFLGNLVVYKNQKYLWARLAPKDTAFLIHLATAKHRHLGLNRTYNNFWPGSKNPARNLAHLLVRIRKALCLPSHFLYVKNNSLCYDCHFITDYDEYQEHLAHAKAFSVASEWTFAQTEYLHAFSLFRAAPFAKMYDNWSEDMRHTILESLEAEAMRFAEACASHGEREKGIETLQKISKIVPCSDEIKNFIVNLAAG